MKYIPPLLLLLCSLRVPFSSLLNSSHSKNTQDTSLNFLRTTGLNGWLVRVARKTQNTRGDQFRCDSGLGIKQPSWHEVCVGWW